MPKTDINRLRRAINAEQKEIVLDIDGRSLHLSHLDKIFWPERGWRKADLIDYYIAVSRYILPHLRHRPLVMVRYPDGIHGESWFHKDVPLGAPDWVRTISVEHDTPKVHTVKYVVCDDLATLVWLAQMGTIEIHAWSATVDDVTRADVAVFDLDPQTDQFSDAAEGARIVCDLLDELKLACYLKTTGKRGIHVFVPLKREGIHAEVRDFAHQAILLLERRNPGLLALSYSKSKRKGRLFIDYAQNSFGKTNVAPYSLRATPDATASTPIRRGDLKRINPHDYRLDNLPRRLARSADLWKDLHDGTTVTVAEARTRLDALAT
jgi:bifunctional non-homologous end joining protein LigD